MSLMRLKMAISANFSLIIGISFFLGLVLPYVEDLPSYVPAILLGAQLFCSCFRISLTDARLIRPADSLAFYLLRFVLLPIVFYFLIEPIAPGLAFCIFFFFLLPPGTSTPGLGSILGANVSLSLFLVAVSSLLMPILLPSLMSVTAARPINIEASRLFWSSAALIFIPILLHIPLRMNEKVHHWMSENNPWLVVPIVSLTTISAIAKQRSVILGSIGSSLWLFAVSCACYAAAYSVWWCCRKTTVRSVRLSYCLASGTNNITLGLVLSLINFPSEVISFMALSHASWIATLIVFKGLSQKKASQ